MSSAAPPVFPGGRTIAAWWRQLAGANPDSLWIGSVHLHCVDIPVEIVRPRRLPQIEWLALKAVSAAAQPASGPAVAQWLGLESGLLHCILQRLQVAGLLLRTEADAWALTDSGRSAVGQGEYQCVARERRLLHFMQTEWLEPAQAHFVHVRRPDQVTWTAAAEFAFAAENFGFLQRRLESKIPLGFPAEVHRLLFEPAHGWDHVPFATPRRCYTALARTHGQAGPLFVGWEVNPRTWELHAVQPVFEMEDEDQAWFPPVIAEEAWLDALALWAGQRDLAETDARRCSMRVSGHRLQVDAPAAWRDKLRGETWLLAGSGQLRQAARLEFA
jgi:hypothetical protein